MAKKDKDKKKKKSESKELVLSTGSDLTKKKKKKKGGDTSINVSGGSDKQVAKVKERPLLAVEKDDYIIVRVGNKNKLCFAHSPKRNTAYVEDTMSSAEPVTIEYDGTTLIANLGREPITGKAFGVDVRPLFAEDKTDFGPIFYYRKLDDAEKKAVSIGIKKTARKLEELGLSHILPISRVEVHPPKGKYAGMYSVSFKSGAAEDKITLFPQMLNDQIYNHYVFQHEIGHAIWYRLLNDKIRAEWLEAFNDSTKVVKAKKSDMEALCEGLVSSQMSVRDFMKDIDEEEVLIFKEALAYFKKVHKMSVPDVDILLKQNSRSLAFLWPTSAAVSTNETLVSDYARTNVHEMFAESYAFYATGKDLGKKLRKLMEKSIKVAAGAE